MNKDIIEIRYNCLMPSSFFYRCVFYTRMQAHDGTIIIWLRPNGGMAR